MSSPARKPITQKSLRPSFDYLSFLGILSSSLPLTTTPDLDSSVIEVPAQKPHPAHDLLARYTLQQKLNIHEACELIEFLDSLSLLVVETISNLFPLSTNTAPKECKLQIGGAEFTFTPIASAGIKLFFTHTKVALGCRSELGVDRAHCIALAQQNMNLEKPQKEYFEFIVVSMHISRVRIMRVAFTRSIVHWAQNSNLADVRDWEVAVEKGSWVGKGWGGTMKVSGVFEMKEVGERGRFARALEEVVRREGWMVEEMPAVGRENGLIEALVRSDKAMAGGREDGSVMAPLVLDSEEPGKEGSRDGDGSKQGEIEMSG